MGQLLKFKNILAIGVIIVIFVVVDFNFLSSHNLKMKKINQEFERIKEGKENIKKWEKTRGNFRSLEKVFLVEESMPFKQFVRSNARKFGIKIISLKASLAEKDDYSEVSMDLDISCSYDNFIKFIREVEKKTIKIKVARITGKKDSGDIKINLLLRGLVVKKL